MVEGKRFNIMLKEIKMADKMVDFPTTVWIKIRKLLSHVTVEPVIFLTILSSSIYQLVTQNLYIEKACRVSLQMDSTICDGMTARNLSAYTEEDEKTVQKLTSQVLAIRSLIQGFFPLCMSLFVGSWSDRYSKRKPLILVPVFGEFISCLCLIVNTVFFYQLPIISTVLSDALPLALMGGWPCLFIGVFSFVAAASSNEDKTVRIGAATSSQTLGMVLGIGSSGILFKLMNFIPTYSFCATLFFLAFVIGYIAIKDMPLEKSHTNAEEIPSTITMVKDFFNVKYVLKTFRVCFKEGENDRRIRIIVVMILSTLLMGPIHGETTVSYLYARHKFGWDAVQFSGFFLVHFLFQLIGNVIALAFFSKYLRFKDASLGIIGVLSSVIGCFMYGFASEGRFFVLGGMVDLFNYSTHIAVRSMMSKIVPSHELGQTNSVFGIFEAVTPLLFGPLYSLLYKNTIDQFPGAFYMFSALLKLISCSLFCFLYIQTGKEERNEKIEKEDEVSPEQTKC